MLTVLMQWCVFPTVTKSPPGMLMAAMRLNIPTIFVSGGPMEAGKTKLSDQLIRLDLVDAMIEAADPNVSDERIDAIERSACPTCGSCSGMFTANSMNCLTEALGYLYQAMARCWRPMLTAKNYS